MRYTSADAFQRLYRKLPAGRQESVTKALLLLERMLQEDRPMPSLGLRELRRGLWEVRAGLLDRLVFSMSRDEVRLLAVGTHDELRRSL
ncbi:MAG: hypothetical protein NTY77_01615 [Elusimicrobia bacterium]|nr:hypothetical protein [Elusimicrobiota bacterium]